MRARNYIALSTGIFAASMLGWWIMFFVLPDARPLTSSERAVWVVAVVLVLPTVPLILLAALVLPPDVDLWAIEVIFSLLSALLWPFLLSPIVRRLRRKGAEPGAPPNGGPATRLGNSGAGGGPPSVS